MGIGVFGKDNAEKGRGNDPESIGADGRTRADDQGIGADADIGADDPDTVVDDSDKATDDSSTAADDSGTAADDSGTEMNADTKTDNLGIAADNPGPGTDADARADELGTVASNKAHAHAVSLFALHRALVLLASFFELVTVYSSSSLPSSSSTTLRSKPILSCLTTLVKQKAPSFRYPMDEMWRPSLSKVSLGMGAVVRFLKFLVRYSQSWLVSCLHLLLMTLGKGWLRQETIILLSFRMEFIRD